MVIYGIAAVILYILRYHSNVHQLLFDIVVTRLSIGTLVPSACRRVLSSR